VDHNIRGAEGEELPAMAYQDEQMIRVAKKFRADTAGNIFRYGFAVFPERTPAVDALARWVRVLCTHPDYAVLRDL
jgi:hypothetical protein